MVAIPATCVFETYRRVYERFAALHAAADRQALDVERANLDVLSGATAVAALYARFDGEWSEPARHRRELCQYVCEDTSCPEHPHRAPRQR